MKVYRRIDDPIYYSLPFNKEISIKTLYLLKEVEERWKKEKGIELSKTALQKIAVDIIKTQNLNLPILNFHYGMTTCASFDSNNKDILELVTEPKEKEKILEGIKEALKDKRHDGIAYRERLYQYNKYKMDFYLAKENLTKLFILYEKDNSKKTFKNELRQAILELSLNYPIKLDKFYFDFERFIRNTQIILSNKKSDEVDNLEIIKGTLIQLWDKLTAFTSFKDAEEFIDNDKKQLFEQIRELNYNFKEMNYKIYIEFNQKVKNKGYLLFSTEQSKILLSKDKILIERLILNYDKSKNKTKFIEAVNEIFNLLPARINYFIKVYIDEIVIPELEIDFKLKSCLFTWLNPNDSDANTIASAIQEHNKKELKIMTADKKDWKKELLEEVHEDLFLKKGYPKLPKIEYLQDL